MTSREDIREAGTILAIGGANSGRGWGCNAIEVRESTGGVGWAWREITDAEKQKLIDALNAPAQQTPSEIVEAAQNLIDEIGQSGTHQRWKRLANALAAVTSTVRSGMDQIKRGLEEHQRGDYHDGERDTPTVSSTDGGGK